MTEKCLFLRNFPLSSGDRVKVGKHIDKHRKQYNKKEEYKDLVFEQYTPHPGRFCGYLACSKCLHWNRLDSDGTKDKRCRCQYAAVAKNVKGKTCLVICASGGIGTLFVQALKNEKARVWGVCSQKNSKTVLQLGVEMVLIYTISPFSQQIREMKEKVDIVFDLVGGKSLEKEAMSILSTKGSF